LLREKAHKFRCVAATPDGLHHRCARVRDFSFQSFQRRDFSVSLFPPLEGFRVGAVPPPFQFLLRKPESLCCRFHKNSPASNVIS
jgi:hypothetical protein